MTRRFRIVLQEYDQGRGYYRTVLGHSMLFAMQENDDVSNVWISIEEHVAAEMKERMTALQKAQRGEP